MPSRATVGAALLTDRRVMHDPQPPAAGGKWRALWLMRFINRKPSFATETTLIQVLADHDSPVCHK
jgi:hypothetical protein